MNNTNFKGTIKSLYTDMVVFSCSNDINELEKECSQLNRNTIKELESWVKDDKKKEVEDLVLDVAYSCAERCFELGFKKAMNIMLDTLIDGESK